jgi:hypothetical protein
VIEDLHDVRAAERGGGLGLTEEAGDELLAERVRLVEAGVDDHLDGDGRLEGNVLGPPHLSHRSATKRRYETVSSRENMAGS